MADIAPIANGESALSVLTKLNEMITRSNECYPCAGGSDTVTFPPITRADLDDAATAGALVPFAPYFIEDEDKVAVATGHSGYIVLQNEVITPCNPLLTEDGIELMTEDGITLCIEDGAVPDSIPLQTADGLYLITEDGIQLSTDA